MSMFWFDVDCLVVREVEPDPRVIGFVHDVDQPHTIVYHVNPAWLAPTADEALLAREDELETAIKQNEKEITRVFQKRAEYLELKRRLLKARGTNTDGVKKEQ
jgi:hypothetical protein